MTNEQVAAVLSGGRSRAVGYLAGLRRSDLEDIARQRGVPFTRDTRAVDLARRVVSQATEQARRGKRSRSRT
jgi:hypothetical protein